MEAILTFLADHWDVIALGVGGFLAHRRSQKKATTKDLMPAKPVKR